MRLFSVLVFFTVLWSTLPAHADTAKPADMTAEDRIEVTRIEDYLNAISTIKAGFTQLASNGESSGTFYLARPGQFAFRLH